MLSCSYPLENVMSQAITVNGNHFIKIITNLFWEFPGRLWYKFKLRGEHNLDVATVERGI